MNFNNKQRDYFLNEGYFPDGYSDADIPVSNPQQELGPFDVICGRCSTAFNNIGNQRFRSTISMNLQRYIDAPTRAHKSKVILSVVEILMKVQGARFVKAKNNNFVELDNKHIRQKVGHALRDMAAQKNFGSSSSSRSSFSSVKSSSSSTSSVSSVEINNNNFEVKDWEENNNIIINNNINSNNMLEDLLITDDLSVEEDISVRSDEVFPDAVMVTPETPAHETQHEMFGRMVYEIDNLNSLLDIDMENEEALMGLMCRQFVAEKGRF